MIEAEMPDGLSARKLVVETAKHNVITAYNAADGLDLLRKFPRVDAIFVHSSLLSSNPDILSDVRTMTPEIPIILAAPFGNISSPDADYVIDSHHPEDLLRLLMKEIPIRTDL
jgi:two-component SAPR family response regulator